MQLAARLAQTLQQYGLGDILWNHQSIGITGRQTIEAQGGEHMVAVANSESGHQVPFGTQPLGDAQLLQHLERPGVDNAGARSVSSLDQPVHQQERNSLLGQYIGDDQARRPGSGYHHVSAGWQHATRCRCIFLSRVVRTCR